MSFDTLVNISLAALLGGLVGFERQWNQGMAGLRTNTLVAFGSACFITIGMHMGDDRVAAQLVSGIGFLGAGVILHEGPTIRGLNTAATLWCAAAAGALAATGLRAEAAYAAIGVVLLNLGLRRVQAAINRRVPHPVDVETAYSIEIICDAAEDGQAYQQLLRDSAAAGLELRGVSQDAISPDVAGGSGSVRLAAELTAHTRIDVAVGTMVREIGSLPGVSLARWNIGAAATSSASGSPIGGVRR
jgi:putative Mg2+ transporter-C (MgtC) family protein